MADIRQTLVAALIDAGAITSFELDEKGWAVVVVPPLRLDPGIIDDWLRDVAKHKLSRPRRRTLLKA